MKTIEEKAKAYDEAIEKLRDFYRDYDTVSCLIDVKEELANLFPALKESEDEKIRKELIDIVEKSPITFAFEDKGKVLAWLEKQGELVNSLSKGLDNAHERIDELIQKNNSLMEQLEKQGEQKPDWSEEDEKLFNLALDMIEWYSGKNEDKSRAVSDWLKSLKQSATRTRME